MSLQTSLALTVENVQHVGLAMRQGVVQLTTSAQNQAGPLGQQLQGFKD